MKEMGRGYNIGKIMGKVNCAEIAIKFIIKYNKVDKYTENELKEIQKSLKEVYILADNIEL